MSTIATTAPALDLTYVRSQFPSLSQTLNGHPAAFLDGPGGTQVPQRVIDAISSYLGHDNANTGGAYATSRHTDAMIARARGAMADFLHCGADEVVFGPNMTSLTFAMSRAIGRELKPGDEILVTRLDHDANVSPWFAIAEDRGVTVRWAEIHDEDCTLDITDLASKINPNTRLVAVGYASNAVGTVNPVRVITQLAHAAGALCYIDAVHYGPHGLIDVAALDCDFLACSTYKFFGPHMGVLYGKKFAKPILIGDTLHVKVRIASKRETNKPDRGILVEAVQLINQRKEIVTEGEHVVMMRRRPAGKR